MRQRASDAAEVREDQLRKLREIWKRVYAEQALDPISGARQFETFPHPGTGIPLTLPRPEREVYEQFYAQCAARWRPANILEKMAVNGLCDAVWRIMMMGKIIDVMTARGADSAEYARHTRFLESSFVTHLKNLRELQAKRGESRVIELKSAGARNLRPVPPPTSIPRKAPRDATRKSEARNGAQPAKIVPLPVRPSNN